MRSNRFNALDFLCDVDDAEAYRFITEELMDEEIDDIRIEGLRHCFIYEEFHPNTDIVGGNDAPGRDFSGIARYNHTFPDRRG